MSWTRESETGDTKEAVKEPAEKGWEQEARKGAGTELGAEIGDGGHSVIRKRTGKCDLCRFCRVRSSLAGCGVAQ